MKVHSSPDAIAFATALLVLLFAIMTVTTAGCTPLHAGRDATTALEQTVRIEADCISTGTAPPAVLFGSGVIVNSHTIITAGHVAQNPDGYICVRTATMSNGHAYTVLPGRVLPERDLATLVSIFPEFDPTYPVVYGPSPNFGARVCSMVSYPMWLWRCGEAQQSAEPPGDRVHTIIVEPGNSGSGVYDMRGRLIGIITHRWSCVTGQLCGGKLSTLEGFVDALLAP